MRLKPRPQPPPQPQTSSNPLPDAQGKFREAETHYERSLALREKVLGPEHPDVAISLSNTAALMIAQVKNICFSGVYLVRE